MGPSAFDDTAAHWHVTDCYEIDFVEGDSPLMIPDVGRALSDPAEARFDRSDYGTANDRNTPKENGREFSLPFDSSA